jgi:YbbR domain-containing protein
VSWIRTVGLRLMLAFLLSFALWVFVSYTQNPDRSIRFDNVPVDTVDLASGLVLVDNNGLPRSARPTVSITVEGATDDLQTVSERDLRAYQDLSGLGPGQYIPDVRVETSRADQVRLRFTPDPQSLPIRLEQEITKTVELTVTVSGRVPFSFRAGAPSVTFQNQSIVTATIRGPQNRVERVVLARVTADIDRLTSTYDSPQALEVIGEDGQIVDGVATAPVIVNVRVPIEPTIGLKRVPVVPAVTGEPASGFLVTGISVDPTTVELTGSELDDLESVETEPVNITGATRTFTRTVTILEPPGARLSTSQPPTAVVTVQVQVFSQPARVTLPIQIRIVDVPSGYQVALSPAAVPFTFQGLPVVLGQLDATSLSAVVSARGLSAGTFTITPELATELPLGIALAGPPPQVTLTLIAPPTPTAEPPTTATPAPETPEAPTPPPATEPPEPIATPEPTATQSP